MLDPALRSAAPGRAPAGGAGPRADGSSGRPGRGSRREPARARTGPAAWFTPPLLAVFASGAGAALVLAGSEVAVVAQLRHLGHLSFTGAVFVIWGVTSIVGGFVYGALHREIPPAVVLLGLAVLTLPIGLASGRLRAAARRAGRAVLRTGADGDVERADPPGRARSPAARRWAGRARR